MINSSGIDTTENNVDLYVSEKETKKPTKISKKKRICNNCKRELPGNLDKGICPYCKRKNQSY